MKYIVMEYTEKGRSPIIMVKVFSDETTPDQIDEELKTLFGSLNKPDSNWRWKEISEIDFYLLNRENEKNRKDKRIKSLLKPVSFACFGLFLAAAIFSFSAGALFASSCYSICTVLWGWNIKIQSENKED